MVVAYDDNGSGGDVADMVVYYEETSAWYGRNL